MICALKGNDYVSNLPPFVTYSESSEQYLDRDTSTAQPGRYMLRQLGLILQLDSDRLTLRFRMNFVESDLIRLGMIGDAKMMEQG